MMNSFRLADFLFSSVSPRSGTAPLSLVSRLGSELRSLELESRLRLVLELSVETPSDCSN